MIRYEIKDSKDVAEFSTMFAQLELLTKMVRELPEAEKKMPRLKRGIVCKACKLKGAARCRQCLSTARAV